jgi:Sulphur oxidation protein SoxZ
MPRSVRPRFLASFVAMIAALLLWSGAALAQDQPDASPALRGQIFGDRPVDDGSAVLAIDAPYRAEDAAIVPVAIRSLLPAGDREAIPLGTMRLRVFAHSPDDYHSGRPEAELMIRHPNYSGLQMDQLTRLYVPAHFVRTVRIWQDERPLLSIESGISISENPDFRFDYQPSGAKTIRAEMVDSKDPTFTGAWPASETSARANQ